MIIRRNGNLFIVKIFKEYLSDIDIYDRDSIILLFKRILSKLRKVHNICGLFNVKVYVNDDYGMIMEIDNVYKYNDGVDIKINFNIDSVFLYEINDNNAIDGNIYYYNGKYYSDCIDDCLDSYVIYNNSLDIINDGIKIK